MLFESKSVFLSSFLAHIGYAAYNIIFFIWIAGQSFFWQLAGIRQHKKKCASLPFDPRCGANENTQITNKCVQVLSIIGRYQFLPIINVSKDDFITLHKTFIDPRLILEDDTISLYSISNTEAMFVRVPKSFNVYDSKHHTFLQVSQYKNAIEVLTMPLQSFVTYSEAFFGKFGEKLKPRPSCEQNRLQKTSFVAPSITVIGNHARCGSCLVGQILEKKEDTRLISEPHALTSLLSKQYSMEKEMKTRVLNSIVRYMCMPRSDVSHYVIKFRYCCMSFGPIIMKAIPSSKHIYTFRKVEPFSKSFVSMINSIFKNSMYIFNLFAPFIASPVTRPYSLLPAGDIWLRIFAFGNSPKEYWYTHIDEYYNLIRASNFKSYSYVLYGHCMHEYQNCHKVNPENCLALQFEDFVANPTEYSKKILEFCNVDLGYLKDAVGVTKRNSHANSPETAKRWDDNMEHLNIEVESKESIFRKMNIVLKYDESNFPGLYQIANH